MKWTQLSKSIPELGEEVLVFRRGDDCDVYAVAHVEESPQGESYWDSDSDIVHGYPLEYVSHWCPLTPPEA